MDIVEELTLSKKADVPYTLTQTAMAAMLPMSKMANMGSLHRVGCLVPTPSMSAGADVLLLLVYWGV